MKTLVNVSLLMIGIFLTVYSAMCYSLFRGNRKRLYQINTNEVSVCFEQNNTCYPFTFDDTRKINQLIEAQKVINDINRVN